MESKEIVLSEDKQLNDLAKKSGIELTKAEAHVRAFHPSLISLGELSRPLAGLDKENPTSEHAKIARENRLKIVKIRTGAEAIKDERKEHINAEGKLIQDSFNLIKSACIVTENEYVEIEKHQERAEAELRVKLSASRTEQLLPFEVDTTYLPLGDMSNEVFDKLLSDSELLFCTKKEAAEKSERDRIESERLAEEKRKEESRIEAARIEAQRIENERLKAEAEKLRKEQEIKDRAAKIEADKLAKIAEEEKAKSDKLVAELKSKQDAEDLAHQKEKERIEAEEADKKAKQKAALLAPDKEKVRILFDAVKAIKVPEFKSEEARLIGKDIEEALKTIKELIIKSSKKLI